MRCLRRTFAPQKCISPREALRNLTIYRWDGWMHQEDIFGKRGTVLHGKISPLNNIRGEMHPSKESLQNTKYLDTSWECVRVVTCLLCDTTLKPANNIDRSNRRSLVRVHGCKKKLFLGCVNSRGNHATKKQPFGAAVYFPHLDFYAMFELKYANENN